MDATIQNLSESEKSRLEPPLPSTAFSGEKTSVALTWTMWLLGNCAALTIGATRLPLTARYPQMAEAFTTHIVLAVEMVFVAWLAPLLLRSWRNVALVVLTEAVFLQIAGLLAQTTITSLVMVTVYVGAWSIAMAMTVRSVAPPRRQPAATTFASLALVGPLLQYLSAESGEKNLASSIIECLPLPAAFSLIDISPFAAKTWVVVLLVSLPGIAFGVIRNLRKNNR